MRSRLRNLGPGLLVAAAFVGPGTVTTASVAGADFGYALLWAVVAATLATVVLQEMAARLGIVSREGLGEALATTFRHPVVKGAAVVLVLLALGAGNAAFEIGNITGAALGLEALTGIGPPVWSVLIGLTAAGLFALGRYRVLERVLVAMVLVMSVLFLLTAALVLPDVDGGDLAAGLVPSMPTSSLVTVIAVVGTTVVPYNLFLHASSVQEKWSADVPTDEALSQARTDGSLAILLGGLVTAAIISTAAAAFFAAGIEVTDGATMAEQLEPLLGDAAGAIFAIGLFAAGLTSTITVPLATAYAVGGVLGWGRDLAEPWLRAVWGTVLGLGTVLAALGQSPVGVIVAAQVANGVLLPIVAVFLLVVMNRRDLLGEHRNGPVANLLGGSVVLFAAGLGVVRVLQALELIPS